MRDITAALLVRLVARLGSDTAPLVKATSIIEHCNLNGIDLQGSSNAKYGLFWDADLEEGAGDHRLQKFKKDRTRQARNAWCLTTGFGIGRVWAAQHGWLLVPWSRKNANWLWQAAGPALSTARFA